MAGQADVMRSGSQPSTLRLAQSELDFWVDMRLRAWGRGWVAEADLAVEREIGVARDQWTALRRALVSLGERRAAEMAGRAAIEHEEGMDR